MQDSTSKEKILKKVRKALINKSSYEPTDVDFETEVYSGKEEPYEFQFAQNFTSINGKFVYCENEQDFAANLKMFVDDNKWDDIFCFDSLISSILKGYVQINNNTNQLANANIGITGCECLVARTGTVMISSKQASGRRLPFFSNIHIVVAYSSQIVYNLKDAFKLIKKKYEGAMPSMINAISGPSRTADIEKTLVQGAHGPKEIFVFLIDNASVNA